MWRCHRAVQTAAQRWLWRNTSPLFAQSARAHQHVSVSLSLYNSSASIGTAAGQLSSNRPLFSSGSHPSLTRYGHVGAPNKYLSDPLLISCHDFSTRRPRVPSMKDLHSVEEVITTAYEHLNVMSPRDISAVWARIAALMSKRQPRQRGKATKYTKDDMEHMLDTIFNNTTDGVEYEYCGARELTGTTLSMAKIVDLLRQQGKRRGEDSSRAILRRLLLSEETAPNRELFGFLANASMKINDFDARCLSNLALAYAKIDYVPEFDDGSDLFDHIAVDAVDMKEDFSEQGISNLMWSCATLNKPHPVLFETIGDKVVALNHLKEFKPQALSNTVWAYATTDIKHPKLFHKVANHIVESNSLHQFRHPQDFSNTVWAYATAGINHPKLFAKMAVHITESNILDQFDPQALKDTVWAYAKAGFNHPRLFDKVAKHIVKSDSLDQFKPQELSNTVWAFAAAGISHPKLFEKVANQVIVLKHFEEFKPQELSNTVWSYATAQVSHPRLFKKVTKAAIQRKTEFNSLDVAHLLWAHATMGIVEKQLFSSFAPTAAKWIVSCNNQELANIAWAYTVANIDAQTLFNKHFMKECVEKKEGFVFEELVQLYQWHLWQTEEKSNAGLPQELLDKCHKAFTSENLTISKLQEDVVAQLVSIDLDPKEEVLMNSGYSIDAVVEVSGKTIGVEVDGPSHFIGKGRSPTGSTILKRRQVPAIDGIELVSVPYWDWNKLGKNKSKKQDYLRKMLGLTAAESES